MGDDADEPVVVVDDGDGEEVVAGELLDHLVTRLLDADADRVLLHEIAHQRIRAGEDQVAERDEADEKAVGAENVDVVDRFTVGGLRTEPGHRLAGGDVGGERGILRRHQGPG